MDAQYEEPAALTNLPDVFQDLNPSTERGYVGAANVPKEEPSDPRVKRKIGSQNVQLWLNPNAQGPVVRKPIKITRG